MTRAITVKLTPEVSSLSSKERREAELWWKARQLRPIQMCCFRLYCDRWPREP